MRNRVFTSGEVAAICGVSPDTVSRWFDLGQIEGYRLGPGGDRRIPYESLKKFMINHGIPLDRFEENERRILVVDDDPHYLDIIPSILSRAGDFTVLTASTGFDAGAMVFQHNPNLVILDIHLSDIDGRTVCKKLKERIETKNSRVLAISGFIDEEEARQLASFGFDGYLRKPFGVAELTAEVNRLLELPVSKIARPKKSGPFA